jgi:hypothetical protein
MALEHRHTCAPIPLQQLDATLLSLQMATGKAYNTKEATLIAWYTLLGCLFVQYAKRPLLQFLCHRRKPQVFSHRDKELQGFGGNFFLFA